jgi:hypothetical protein
LLACSKREAAAKRPRSGRDAAAKRPRSGREAAATRPHAQNEVQMKHIVDNSSNGGQQATLAKHDLAL